MVIGSSFAVHVNRWMQCEHWLRYYVVTRRWITWRRRRVLSFRTAIRLHRCWRTSTKWISLVCRFVCHAVL